MYASYWKPNVLKKLEKEGDYVYVFYNNSVV